MPTASLKFPKDFLWGTATAGHQVEGNNVNSDWWAWEKSRSDIEDSGIACDHYHLYKKDFKLIKNILYGNAYRFSIEWSRIEPREGVFNKKETEHYKNVLKELKILKIKSLLTLHHFVSPLWFSKKGGFEKRKNLKYFERYVKYCAKEFGELVDFWGTINEPGIYASMSYLNGVWPPQKKSLTLMIRVYLNLAKAHVAAYKVIHERTGAGVMPVISVHSFVSKKPLIKLLAKCVNFFDNHSFLFLIKRNYDFIGINYYGPFETSSLKFSEGVNEESSIGWKIHPKGVFDILTDFWKKYRVPIFVTENGCADADDANRQEYIIDHLLWINRAINKGVDVRGYFYWSLMDNFEWDKGRSVRFGLFETSYKTFERIPRKSAFVYGEIVKANSL